MHCTVKRSESGGCPRPIRTSEWFVLCPGRWSHTPAALAEHSPKTVCVHFPVPSPEDAIEEGVDGRADDRHANGPKQSLAVAMGIVIFSCVGIQYQALEGVRERRKRNS